eukprot:s3421_g2.t2
MLDCCRSRQADDVLPFRKWTRPEEQQFELEKRIKEDSQLLHKFIKAAQVRVWGFCREPLDRLGRLSRILLPLDERSGLVGKVAAGARVPARTRPLQAAAVHLSGSAGVTKDGCGIGARSRRLTMRRVLFLLGLVVWVTNPQSLGSETSMGRSLQGFVDDAPNFLCLDYLPVGIVRSDRDSQPLARLQPGGKCLINCRVPYYGESAVAECPWDNSEEYGGGLIWEEPDCVCSAGSDDMNFRVDLRLGAPCPGEATGPQGPQAWTENSSLGGGRLECCLDAMATQPGNVYVQTSQIKIMAEFFQQAGQCRLDRMLLQECLDLLAAAMHNHEHNAQLQAESCCALHVMASTLGASLKGLQFADVVSQLVEAMKTYSRNPFVWRWAARALGELSNMLDPAALERATVAGALDQLQAMPNDDGRFEIQRRVAWKFLRQALSYQDLQAPVVDDTHAAHAAHAAPGPQSSQEPDLQPATDGRMNSSPASDGRLLGVDLVGVDTAAPEGIQVCQACNAIFEGLMTSETGSEAHRRWQKTPQDICEKAKEDSQESDVLKKSVFGLMPAKEIENFLLSTDHRRWKIVEGHTEHFLDLLDEPGTRVALPRSPPRDTAERVQLYQHHHPDPDHKWRSLRPVVLDQSIREPATNTPFGHTGYMKYLTLQIIRKMEFNDIAITGQYYGEKYTPETQVLEWIKYKGEKDGGGKLVKDPMHGLVAMFAPGDHDRAAGIQSIKDFRIPNAFLDLTFKASVRFKDTNFVQSVINAVKELDEIYSQWGWQRSWRSEDAHINNEFAYGEISLNLVDLMEYLNLRGDGTMEKQKMEDVAKAFKTWKDNDAFRRRVVAILVEEGRGVADYEDYGTLVSWIRESFPANEQYRVLVHAHAGTNNHQDVASLKAVKHGANGIWAALIPQAAQAGHNSSLVFLDYLLHHGNEHVLRDFRLFQALECARHIYYLNFNTHDIPDDCPIWGERVGKETHSAFNVLQGETWRRKTADFYDYWGDQEKKDINKLPEKVGDLKEEGEGRGNYRISPLVSDTQTWLNRMVEAKAVEPGEIVDDYVDMVKALGFALMNAGIRVNLDRKKNLKTLVDIAREAQKTKPRDPCNCRRYPSHERNEKMKGEGGCKCLSPSYLKAEQHQGSCE